MPPSVLPRFFGTTLVVLHSVLFAFLPGQPIPPPMIRLGQRAWRVTLAGPGVLTLRVVMLCLIPKEYGCELALGVRSCDKLHSLLGSPIWRFPSLPARQQRKRATFQFQDGGLPRWGVTVMRISSFPLSRGSTVRVPRRPVSGVDWNRGGLLGNNSDVRVARLYADLESLARIHKISFLWNFAPHLRIEWGWSSTVVVPTICPLRGFSVAAR